MHHIDTVFRSYNLSGNHSKDSFALGVRKWAFFIKNRECSQMSHGAIVERFNEILDEAWEATHIRCQLAEKLAMQAEVGSDEENDEWCKCVNHLVINIGYAFLGSQQGCSRYHENPCCGK
jgi:hypothetical protein